MPSFSISLRPSTSTVQAEARCRACLACFTQIARRGTNIGWAGWRHSLRQCHAMRPRAWAWAKPCLDHRHIRLGDTPNDTLAGAPARLGALGLVQGVGVAGLIQRQHQGFGHALPSRAHAGDRATATCLTGQTAFEHGLAPQPKRCTQALWGSASLAASQHQTRALSGRANGACRYSVLSGFARRNRPPCSSASASSRVDEAL